MQETRLLDTSFEMEAPEFTVFSYYTAGPSIRLFAILLDHFIFFALIVFIFISFMFLASIDLFSSIDAARGASLFAILILLFFVYWFYFFLQEYFLRGRTLGKIVAGLRVISVDGTSLDFFQILIRNLLRFADMFPMQGAFFPSYFIGSLFSFFFARSFQRLGDLAAGTIVIRERRSKRKQADVLQAAPRILELARSLELRGVPDAALTRAIHAFALRERLIHPARAEEIAKRVKPSLRKLFGADSLDCTAKELLLAIHHFLHHYEFGGFPKGHPQKWERSMMGKAHHASQNPDC